jgi:hypothetical protein
MAKCPCSLSEKIACALDLVGLLDQYKDVVEHALGGKETGKWNKSACTSPRTSVGHGKSELSDWARSIIYAVAGNKTPAKSTRNCRKRTGLPRPH